MRLEPKKPSLIRYLLAFLLLVFVATPDLLNAQDDDELPIFPGAVGYGRLTEAGRGTSDRPAKVYKVDTCVFEGEIDEDGKDRTGLQECLVGNTNRPPEGNGPTTDANYDPRVCVFEVSCYIDLPGNVIIDKPYLTIAGQTAPSPGVTLRFGKLDVQTHDVLIQHLAVRTGFNDDVPPWSSFAIGAQSKGLTWKGQRVYDLYFDHVSASFARDANWSFHAQMDSPDGVRFGEVYAERITVANSISSEGLFASGHVDANPPLCWPCDPDEHEGCIENWDVCRGHNGFDPDDCSWENGRCAFRGATEHSMAMRVSAPFREVSLVGNLFASNNARSPKVQGSHQSINNLVYNRGSKSFDIDAKILEPIAPAVADLIGNVIMDGPNSAPSEPMTLRRQIVEGEVQVYFEDNAFGGRQPNGQWIPPSVPEDPYDDDHLYYFPSNLPPGSDPLLINLIQTEPIHPLEDIGIEVRPWDEVYGWVRNKAGTRPWDLTIDNERADPTDRRILAQIADQGLEFINCVDPNDVNSSQIPDGFDLICGENTPGWPAIPETRHQLDPPEDPQGDEDSDGYTNLEEWLHEKACEVSCAPGEGCPICVED